MPFDTKNILFDKESRPIPQKWNQAGDTYIPFSGGLEIQTGFAIGSITVGATATELKAGASALTARRKMLLRVSGNDAVYIGPSSAVTTGIGYPVLPGETLEIQFDPMVSVSVWAIAASNQVVKIMEIN